MSMEAKLDAQIMRDRDDPQADQWIYLTGKEILQRVGQSIDDPGLPHARFAEWVRRGLLELDNRWLAPHPDQEAIITAALDLAKEAVSTEDRTVALVAIAWAFTGTGIAFKDWKQALAFDRKYTHDVATFAQQVLMFLQELCPELVLETTITQDHAQPGLNSAASYSS